MPENPRLVLVTCRHEEDVPATMHLLESIETDDDGFYVFECPKCGGQVSIYYAA